VDVQPVLSMQQLSNLLTVDWLIISQLFLPNCLAFACLSQSPFIHYSLFTINYKL